MATKINTSLKLYKFLIRETRKLPPDAGKFYKTQIKAVRLKYLLTLILYFNYLPILIHGIFIEKIGVSTTRRGRRSREASANY